VSTILVTGGAGFVGSHLCDRLLAGGHKIVALDDLSHGRIANLVEARTYGERFTFYNMDIRAQGLRDLFEKHEPEVVMHLAAQDERSGIGGRPDAGCEHQRDGPAERPGERDAGRRSQGGVYLLRRHDLRRPEEVPHQGERAQGGASRFALRHLEAGGRELPDVLQGRPRA